MVAGQIRRSYDRIYPRDRMALAVPVCMLLLATAVLGASYLDDGHVLDRGIDFTGGTSVQIQVPDGVTTEDVAAAFPDATVRTLDGDEARWIVAETTVPYDDQEIRDRIDSAGIPYDGDYSDAVSIQSLGPGVGSAFFREAQMWAGVALLIMSAVIFIAFRSFVPSFAVIFAAVTDIVVAMAGMALLGIDLTLGSLAALLMLLGYSVDTDILLSTRVLKQEDDPLQERIWSAVVTGSTMTFTAIAAFTMLYLLAAAGTLREIASVIIIGLLADLPITWLGNAFILKWYVRGDD